MKNKEIIHRKTKILATLGPSSNTIKKITELTKAGSNAFRLNCSHLNEESLKDFIKKIRKVEKIIKKPIGILVDLQGPKIRIGNVSEDDNVLNKGDIFILDDLKEIGNSKRVSLPNKKIFKSIKKGHLILIDDGKYIFTVLGKKNNQIIFYKSASEECYYSKSPCTHFYNGDDFTLNEIMNENKFGYTIYYFMK